MVMTFVGHNYVQVINAYLNLLCNNSAVHVSV